MQQLDVLVVDCQATAARAQGRGHLLELGWALAGETPTPPRACLIKLPEGERIPWTVARLTGITHRMLDSAVDADTAWRELAAEAAKRTRQPAPAVAHYARFEQPFLHALAGGAAPPLDLVCTHEIARRLLPDLPRRSLRALTGYFGRPVSALRRSADHVDATAFVWQSLVLLLEGQGIVAWEALIEWLAAPVASSLSGAGGRRRRVWPMPRDVRLAVPDAPGVYRLMRTGGSLLYIGKATSLHRRVNSYFGQQRHAPDRMLEMLSQARELSVEVTESTLEAALLEADEIKRHRPPYNIALAGEHRDVWFTTADLLDRSTLPSPSHPLGPFRWPVLLDRFAALANGSADALADRWWPVDPVTFDEGYARFRAAHPELSREDLSPSARLLRVGTRLWRQGRRDKSPETSDDEPIAPPTAEEVQGALERLVLRAALARRVAKWVTRLSDAAITWREADATNTRLIVVERGEIVLRAWIDAGTPPPLPAGVSRSRAARHEGFTVAHYDRVRVLLKELKSLAAEGSSVALRIGAGPVIADARLAAALAWV